MRKFHRHVVVLVEWFNATIAAKTGGLILPRKGGDGMDKHVGDYVCILLKGAHICLNYLFSTCNKIGQ